MKISFVNSELPLKMAFSVFVCVRSRVRACVYLKNDILLVIMLSDFIFYAKALQFIINIILIIC